MGILWKKTEVIQDETEVIQDETEVRPKWSMVILSDQWWFLVKTKNKFLKDRQTRQDYHHGLHLLEMRQAVNPMMKPIKNPSRK